MPEHAEESNVIPFLRTHAFELRAPDGRRWCACVYMPDWGLNRLVPGASYTLRELTGKYGLYPREDGSPGLFLREGEEYPLELTYVVERLYAGQE